MVIPSIVCNAAVQLIVCAPAVQSGEAISLDCQCRGDLALRHRACAIKWSRVKGDAVCDICKSTVCIHLHTVQHHAHVRTPHAYMAKHVALCNAGYHPLSANRCQLCPQLHRRWPICQRHPHGRQRQAAAMWRSPSRITLHKMACQWGWTLYLATQTCCLIASGEHADNGCFCCMHCAGCTHDLMQVASYLHCVGRVLLPATRLLGLQHRRPL